MERCLQEFRVRGVKTNIPFLINLVTHPAFLAGQVHDAVHRRDAGAVPVPVRAGPGDQAARPTSAEVIVNGHPDVQDKAGRRPTAAAASPCPALDRRRAAPAGHARQASRNSGPRSSPQWVREQKPLLLTDTTFRDAHQSLLATRMRTHDMLRDRRRLRAGSCRAVLARDVGRGDVRHVDAVPQGSPVGAAGRAARDDPQHPVPDAAAGRQRRRLHELSRQRRQGVRQGVGRRPASTCSASSTRSTGCRTCKLGHRGRAASTACSARRDLLHRRHPRPEARPSTT